MALGDLLIKVGIDGSNINKDLAKIRRKLDKSAARFSSIGANISMGISAPLGILGTQAITTAAEFQTLETGLQTLTGSVDKGTAAFERLKEFSAQTPFQLQDLVAANNTMMGFGLTSEDAFTSLNQLGDIAAVMGSDLNSMSLAFGQSAASGVAMTADINQFINQGVPMYKLLEDVTGKNTKELKKMASESKITFPLIQKALKAATEEGGMFFEGMKKGSQTLGGVLSTFKDKLALALGTLGESIAETINFKDVVGKLGDAIGKATKFFAGLSDTTKKIIIGVTGVIAVLGPLMFGLGGLVNVLSSATSGLQLLNSKLLTNPYVLAAAAVAALTLGIRRMLKEQNRIPDMRKNIDKAIEKNSMSYVKEKVKINNLLKPVNNLMLSTKQREKALKELQREYPKYFDDLNIEEGKVLDVTEAYDKLIEKLKTTARQRAISSMLEDLQKRKLDIEMDLGMKFDGKGFDEIRDEVVKAGREGSKSFGQRFKNTIKQMLTDMGVGEFTEEWQQAQRAVQEYINLQDEIKRLTDMVDPAAIEETNKQLTNTGKASGKASEKTRTYRDDLKDVDSLLRDKIIHNYAALADKMQIVREEMERVSKAGKNNQFGESVDDLREKYNKLHDEFTLENIDPSKTGEQYMSALGEWSEGETLVLRPKLAKVEPIKTEFSFENVMGALDSLGLGNELSSAFQNLFDSIDKNLEKKGKQIGEKLKAGFMIGLSAFDLINQGFNLMMDAQQRKLDKAHELEMNRIDASTASEEVKQKRKALAEKVYEKKSQAIKKRMAQRDKARAIFEATINTAAAMTKVLGTPLMAVVAALGAAQVATIAATPIPMAKGGILSGPTNILAGEYMGARNNPEIIAPLDKLRNMINTDQNINLSGSFRLTGDDLLLAVEQANKTRQRQGGITLF